jgi:hypothetical protein
MNEYKNPQWWSARDDSDWERVKMAMKRDWDQTKHDMGGDEPDTNQSIGHTSRQATGKEAIPPRGQPNYEELEPAYRYGYGARSKYGNLYRNWDDDLELRLKQEWQEIAPNRRQTWLQDRTAIRYGWDYDDVENLQEVDTK